MKVFLLTRPQKDMLDAVAYAATMKRPLQINVRKRTVLRRLISSDLVRIEEGEVKYVLTGDGAHARTYWRIAR